MAFNKNTQINLDQLKQTLCERYQYAMSHFTQDNLSLNEIIDHIVNYYQDIISCMPGNIYWLNKDLVTIGCNKNVLMMFGFTSPEEFKGLTFEEMGRIGNWTREAEQSFKKDTLEVIQTGKPKLNVEEPPIPHHDGHTIYFLTSRVPLFDKKHNVIGIVGISIDVTERKLAEERLKEAKEIAEIANQTKTAFLENMRHDIRTPLTGIVAFANLLKEEAKDEKSIEYADNLIASSHSLFELMNEILESIKITSGEIPLVKKKFNLKERLNSIISLNQALAHQKHLEFFLVFEDKIPNYIIADSTRIHRIVLELVTNALKFTEHGSVTVNVSLIERTGQDPVLKIIVEDTGIGIPLDKKDEIFFRFSRLMPSYEGLYRGAGLGLSIVKQFINELNGEIYVESLVGTGSKFTCLLPVQASLLDNDFGSEIYPTKTAWPKSREMRSSKLGITSTNHILLIEDDKLAGCAASSILQNLDCKVDLVTTGKAAIELVKEKVYDLIFMDIGLPDMNGYEVTKNIRLNELIHNAHSPIIALSAHIDTENKQKCIETGMNAVLSKPLTKHVAQDILDTFISNHENSINQPEKMIADEQDLFALAGEVVNFNKAVEILGNNEKLAHEMLTLMIKSLPEEISQLKNSYNHKDWKELQKITHKICGAASYCGTERLKIACANLENYIKSGKIDLTDKLYEQLLSEIESVQETYAKKFE